MPGQRLPFALLALLSAGTVALQFWLNIERRGGAGPALISMLGFFSIWTHLIVAGVCLRLAGRVGKGWSDGQISLATAATYFIVFVGLAYEVLLSADHNPRGIFFYTNLLLHYVVPFGMLALWLTFVPKGRLRLASVLPWLGFPLVYFGYVLIRGELTGRYPYYFLNVARYGYGEVLMTAGGFTLAFLALGLGFVALDRLLGRRRQVETS